MTLKTGVLLVNLGTPDSPSWWDVFRYLNEFLTDGRVIDIPWLLRQILVRGRIVPFRTSSSAEVYRKVWTEKGSPLLFHSEDLTRLVQDQLGEDYVVQLAMRYQNPSIEEAVESFQGMGLKELVILPLFPQYASASSGSVMEKVCSILSKWQAIPSLRIIDSFPTQPQMIKAFVERGKNYEPKGYDHIIFSFHGLPERQIHKADCHDVCLRGQCCSSLGEKNSQCYRAQCFATARAIASELDLSPENYTVAFQSRLGKNPWIQPYISDVFPVRANKGDRRLLVFCPSFVCDCLETTVEVGEEYAEDWEKLGGEQLDLVEGLNTHPLWVQAVVDLVKGKECLKTKGIECTNQTTMAGS